MPEPVHLGVEAAYDRWSAVYDDYENPMVFTAGQALTALDLPMNADVVEFGCGTGRNLAILAARGAGSLTGLDFSTGMLEKARVRNPGFTLLRHDMREPAPLADACADFALFCLALEHVADLATPLAEAARVLRPGGRLVLLEIHPYLSMGGVAAHFVDEAGEVRMPTYPHRIADHLTAIIGAGMVLTACQEWRPRDLVDPPRKVMKRGPDTPLVLELRARRLV